MVRNYPLTALRAFESAGRHLSFIRAADELAVTPAAISQQIKRLEIYLGAPLFRRLPRGLLLTDSGQQLLRDLGPAFVALDTAIDRAKEQEATGALTISVAPMFATKWLVPRLERFDRAYPDIDLRVSSSLHTVDFIRDSFDAAVRLGGGDYPGLHAAKLFDESLVPMCSPALLNRLDLPCDHSALRKMVLLHNDSMAFDSKAPDWARWLREAQLTGVDPTRGPRFEQPDHAIQAAIDGAGAVLGWLSLAKADIHAGRLVPLSDLALPLGSAFYLVFPKAHQGRQKIQLLEKWINGEISEHPDALAVDRP